LYVNFWQGGKTPDAIASFPVTLGGGYYLCSQSLAVPGKQLPPETLAVIRKKRITRRVAAKVPMFADHFIAEAIAKKPEYYDGVTDAKLKEALDAQNIKEWERYYFFTAHIGELIIYGNEPQVCRERAAKIKAEMDEVKRKAEERKKAAA
jgi:hypothetical protein